MGPMRIGQLHPVAEQTYFTKEKEVTLRFSYLMKQFMGTVNPCVLFVLCVLRRNLFSTIWYYPFNERKERTDLPNLLLYVRANTF